MTTLNVRASLPNPRSDAEARREAFEGGATNEQLIIDIPADGSPAYIKEIRDVFEQQFGEDVLKKLEGETTSHLEKVVFLLALGPSDRDALLAAESLKKHHHVLIEISCTQSAHELLAAKQAYQARYKRSLEEDVADSVHGNFGKLLLGLVSTYRYEGPEVDMRLAKSEAKLLNEAIKDKAFDHENVIRILTTRSKAQLNATFNHYNDEFGVTINKAMEEKDGDNEFVQALSTVVLCISSPFEYYVKVLKSATEKLGRDEETLLRVIVTRAEKDLSTIKGAYAARTALAANTSPRSFGQKVKHITKHLVGF